MPIPAAHLAENNGTSSRSLTTGRPFPLGEPDRPFRSAGTPAELEAILRYLDVETSARYQRTDTQTYCNVYACDYCYLAGVYLPRVWWTPRAIADIDAGRMVTAKYADTVAELNANALYAWLRDFGPAFGWSRTDSLEQLQRTANAGQVSVICAQRSPLNKPGHIALVVPDLPSPQDAPLQSQAGRINYQSSRAPGRWWESQQFRAYGFWMHS